MSCIPDLHESQQIPCLRKARIVIKLPSVQFLGSEGGGTVPCQEVDEVASAGGVAVPVFVADID